MAKFLVVVESPAKAKTIGRFLGKNYTVKASMGHVRDLPKSQIGVDTEDGFTPKYITIRGKGEIVKELRQAAKGVQAVLLAPDPDREGEAIAWHLAQLLGIEEHVPCRIQFNEITQKAIQHAIKHPRPIDINRVDAQQARRVLDRLVGYNLSPLLWRKVRKGLSAGRVQSVAVRLIVEREREIQQFVPEEYWSLTAHFKGGQPLAAFEAKLQKISGQATEISSEDQVQGVLKDLEGRDFLVHDVRRREKMRHPAPPFTTSTLQQEANRKLGFTARKTMGLAQQLYEGIELSKKVGAVGLITYIRTDSTRISTEAQQEARQYIQSVFGQDYLPAEPRQYAGKKQTQDAHEAIRPTSVAREPEGLKDVLTPDQLKLYRLIWSRFIASQMQSAVLDITTADITAGEYLFRAIGSVIKFSGFMRVYREEEEGDNVGLLPALETGQRVQVQKLVPKQHFTQPPPRYSDASLVKTLEERGIGRPSTYAPTIETITQRGYVIRRQKQFVPTELGMVVTDLLKRHFPDIIDVDFTAEMEDHLDQVENGQMDWHDVVAQFYYPFKRVLAKAEEEIGTIELADEESEEICEKCGRRMVYKMGRFGKFLACPGFPSCRNTKPVLEPIGVTCPLCEGALVERQTKKGRRFYGCENYPHCEYMSWDKPSMEKCPVCQQRLVEKGGKRSIALVCSNPACNGDGPRAQSSNSGEVGQKR